MTDDTTPPESSYHRDLYYRAARQLMARATLLQQKLKGERAQLSAHDVCSLFVCAGFSALEAAAGPEAALHYLRHLIDELGKREDATQLAH